MTKRNLRTFPLITLLIIVFSMCMMSCGNKDNSNEPQDSNSSQEMIVGKWISTYNSGAEWEEPMECCFNSDGTGYQWFTDEPFAYRDKFTYTITKSALVLKTDDGTVHLTYEFENNGKMLILYGWDEDDMEELHLKKQ